MQIGEKKSELIFLILLISIVVGLPLGILAYDRYLWPHKTTSGAREFTLTGSAQSGWLLGEVQAYDMLSLEKKQGSSQKPVIEVSKGDQVVIKLRSSDVAHGFSLKAFGIYLTEPIKPGKTAFVSFKADKVGTFVFACNVFCGGIHQNMQGTLVVKDR
jgi:nitrosocyanin